MTSCPCHFPTSIGKVDARTGQREQIGWMCLMCRTCWSTAPRICCHCRRDIPTSAPLFTLDDSRWLCSECFSTATVAA